MKLLLDTHIFLWFISGDIQLPGHWRTAIEDPLNEVYLSVASSWEIIVKYELGKLPLPQAPQHYIPAKRALHQIESLALDEASTMHLPTLPALHRDPFDRMLICQALAYGLTLVSADPIVKQYQVAILK